MERVGSQAFSFVIGIILARLLVPDDFGLIAMVMVFTGFAEMLSNFGLGSALIHKREISDIHYNSIFFINLILGICVGSILYLFSPEISIYYGRDELVGITKALSITLVLSGMTMVPRSILAKEMKFKKIAQAEFISMISAGGLSVYLAYAGYGYWSLVINIIIRQALLLIMLHVFSSVCLRLQFSYRAIEDMIKFSAYVFATKILQYTSGNIDKLLLGKYFGGSALGVYDKAGAMMLFPLTNISHVIAKVLFPTLSSIQDDKQRIKNIFLKSVASISLFTYPMLAGLFVVSDTFILGVLGESWRETIPLLRIFCIAGLAISIATSVGPLYLAQGLSKLQFKVNLATQTLKLLFVLVGLQWGLMGVAVTYSLAIVLNAFITLGIAGKTIQMSVYEVLKVVAPVFMTSLFMSIVVYAWSELDLFDTNISILISQIFVGVFIYILLVIVFDLKAFSDLRQAVSLSFR
jgi:PST family polysaccharide transporter